MKEQNVNTTNIHPASLTKRMFVGAFIGLVVISFFVFGVDNPHPEWPKYWMVKPLIMVPIAGAMGGLLNYNLDHLRFQGGRMKVLAVFLNIAGYLLCLWLGTVFGLNGTMWN